jgi:BirA family biotin operon repressor/biotin-[acetyl-CoA-carboxylase] ligase
MNKNELSPEIIKTRLRTKLIGHDILYYPTISSTMDAARRAASEGAVDGTVIIADYQTAGRGRLDREWLSTPGGSILISIILYPEEALLLRLTMVACLAVARSIEQVTGLKTAIKWPNDVLIGGKKASGILCESEVRDDSVNHAVVGIALNVNLDPAALPEISDTATSLSKELGRAVPRVDVLVALLEEFESLYNALRQNEPIHLEWRKRLETLGKNITVTGSSRVYEGCAESVDEDGNLLLREADGNLLTISAGDVTLKD